MKKLMNLVFVFLCALSSNVFAQYDEYEEYASDEYSLEGDSSNESATNEESYNDSYSEESYASVDEDGPKSSYDNDDEEYTPVTKKFKKKMPSYDDDEYEENAPAPKKMSKKKIASYNDADDDTPARPSSQVGDRFFHDPFHTGIHIGLGYAGTWNNTLAWGSYNGEIAEKDPFDGYVGFVGDLGMIFNYHLFNVFSVVPEINVRFLGYFRESEYWYLKTSDGPQPVYETMMRVGVNVPLVLRINPTPYIYIDGGVDINLNVYSEYSLSNSDYDFEEKMGEWKAEMFGWGILFGGGMTFDTGDFFMDVGLRATLDMTRIEKNVNVNASALNNSYRSPTGTRMWGILLVFNVYLI